MNKENCALKMVDEIILYYYARSKKHQITLYIYTYIYIYIYIVNHARFFILIANLIWDFHKWGK